MAADADPFSSIRSRVANPALSVQHALGPDIYDRLFDRIFFHTKEYGYWSKGNQSWQLHCYGAPGCGKTTLAAIAAQKLRTVEHGKYAAPVASVFIEKDVSMSAGFFLEDVLLCIHDQLPRHGSEIDHHLKQYEKAYRKGESVSKRVALLRTALYSRLDEFEYTFLLLDGYDRVSEGLQVLLDREFSDMKAYRVRVLQTRRVPVFVRPLRTSCDGDCDQKGLRAYWVCVCRVAFSNAAGLLKTDYIADMHQVLHRWAG
jgi:hypothetical protein